MCCLKGGFGLDFHNNETDKNYSSVSTNGFFC